MVEKNTRYYNKNSCSHFGGIIKHSDFYTNYAIKRNIALRIASDWSFDEQCRKNEEARDRRIKEETKNEKIILYKNKWFINRY